MALGNPSLVFTEADICKRSENGSEAFCHCPVSGAVCPSVCGLHKCKGEELLLVAELPASLGVTTHARVELWVVELCLGGGVGGGRAG